MIELYWTKNRNLHRKVEILVSRKHKKFEILKTPNGKPYVAGNPIYFSISHSYNYAVIALCDKPVGIDFEHYDVKGRIKNYKSVLNRFTERERGWIGDNSALFFLNWVCKEAYVKMLGGTLATYLKRLEYIDYKLYCDKKEVDCGYVAIGNFTAGIYAVCAEGYTNDEISDCRMTLFRIRKGEKL